MKKTSKMLLVAIVCSLFAMPSMAQGVYVKVNAGYGFPAGTQTIYNYDQNSETGFLRLILWNILMVKGLIL